MSQDGLLGNCMLSAAMHGLICILQYPHLLDAGKGWLGGQHLQDRAMKDVEVVVLQVCAHCEPLVPHQ